MLTLVVILPFFPIIWVVNEMVRYSYHVGVNAQVENALGQGVAFSRTLYQLYKQQLIDSAQHLASMSEPVNSLPTVSDVWHPQLLQYRNVDLTITKQIEDGLPPPYQPQRHHFEELTAQHTTAMIFADRTENSFIAVAYNPLNKHYVALCAELDSSFLAASTQNLQVYQLYRTLALSPSLVPKQFLLAFAAFSLLIIAGALGTAFWLSRRISAPISDLVKGTEAVGKGNLHYRIPKHSNDELGELVEHFNQMSSQLQIYQERTIFLEKMAAWQEIARRLAHEIKNPLTPIQLTIQEMVDRYNGDDREYQQLLTECYHIINEEIEQLRKLVREFSDFGRLPPPNFRPLQLNQLVREVCKIYAHHPLKCQLTEALPETLLDEDSIKRMLVNLIENAIQADKTGGEVLIQTKLNGNFIELVVADNGTGIPMNLLDKIFDPYFTTREDGTGLGLTIVRQIVETHNGNIQVESKQNTGTRFTIRLPVAGSMSSNKSASPQQAEPKQ